MLKWYYSCFFTKINLFHWDYFLLCFRTPKTISWVGIFSPNALLRGWESFGRTFSHFSEKKIDLIGAGRTDAGVHAKQIGLHILMLFISRDIEDLAIIRLNLLPAISQWQKYLHGGGRCPRPVLIAHSRTYEYLVGTIEKKNPFLIPTLHTM